ncbi:MAG: SDR family oxidoreductase [Alphaproteobacteria bacterium]
MILVIGANGNTGRALVQKLLAKGARVRGLGSNPRSAAAIEAAGAEAIVGDFNDEATLAKAMQGAERVFHVMPPLHPGEIEVGRKVIDAAVRAGVRHLVYMTLVLELLEELDYHWNKLRVHQLLHRASADLAYTVMQPTSYMQNISWAWPSIMESGQFALPYSADQGMTWVDMQDAAEAMANVLTEDGHEYATYELVGTPPLSRREVCEIISRVMGRRIEAVVPDLETFLAQPHWRVFRPDQLAQMRATFQDFDRCGIRAGSPKVLAMLLGRQPSTYEAFITRFAASPELQAWKRDATA